MSFGDVLLPSTRKTLLPRGAVLKEQVFHPTGLQKGLFLSLLPSAEQSG